MAGHELERFRIRYNADMKGIYIIKNLVNGHCYIGSSVNMRSRWYKHKGDLNKGEHHNIVLQKAWKKYGANAFLFAVWEETSNLTEREQFFIDTLKPYYNIAGVSLPRPNGYKRIVDSDTREKKSAALSGKPWSEARRRAESNKSAYPARKANKDKKAFCKNGHSRNEANDIIRNGIYKGCRTCQNEAKRKKRQALHDER